MSRPASVADRRSCSRWIERRLPTTAAYVAVVLFAAAPARAALTEAPRLTAIYDAILEARFDDADARLKQSCPPAPTEACKALQAVSVWWQILLDPDNRALDGRLNDLATAAIAASDAWTRREPQRAEAWFYLAGSYAPLVQWRVLRGERLAAAREGNRIRDALERALRLDSTLDDAYFGIGAYHYYADVAPAAAKILRWMLFLPGGDRVKGLQEMLQARQRGALLKGEADYQLHVIYLWYERKPERAIELLEGLDARYPSNPLFLRRLAEVQAEWVHDRPASAAAWQKLLERASMGRVHSPASTEARARLGLATELDELYETDRAIDVLKPIVDRGSAATRPLVARAQAQLGRAYDRLGERALAVKAYSAALDSASDAGQATRERAQSGLGQSPNPRITEAYGLSVDGWRAFERGSLDRAKASLTRAIELDPADQVAGYRYARVLEAVGDLVGARRQLERVLATRTAPAVALAPSYLAYARLLERAGDRARAIDAYRYAVQVVGGGLQTREEARSALKRLGAS